MQEREVNHLQAWWKSTTTTFFLFYILIIYYFKKEKSPPPYSTKPCPYHPIHFKQSLNWPISVMTKITSTTYLLPQFPSPSVPTNTTLYLPKFNYHVFIGSFPPSCELWKDHPSQSLPWDASFQLTHHPSLVNIISKQKC